MASKPNPSDSTGVPAGALIGFGVAMLGLAIALAAAMTVMSGMKSRELALQSRELVLRKQADSLGRALDRALGRASSLGDELRTQVEGLEEWELAELRAAGLVNPIAQLKADLRAHPELIPFKGGQGGTMGIHSDESVQILGPRWALADFDDGHQSGSMLLEFQVASAKIRWRRLAARLD